MGVLMQIRGMFSEVNMSLSSIIMEYQGIASAVASLQRIMTFKQLMKNHEKSPHHLLPINSHGIHIPSLHLHTPTGSPIWTSPAFDLKAGDRKILKAPSGTGKTSLLRMLSGIHVHQDGKRLSLGDEAMIIPQRPYMPIGTLKQCLTYPLDEDTHNTETIENLMIQCQLKHLMPFLDKVADYQNRLSLGEQQRINFVRVLLKKPQWLLMDEPLSSLNHDYAEMVIAALDTSLPKAGILIVSHQDIQGFRPVSL